MKPRTCPHCQTVLPIVEGYTFDKDLNLLCGSCHKIVFPATVQAEWQGQPYNPSHHNGSYGPEMRRKHMQMGMIPGDMNYWHENLDDMD